MDVFTAKSPISACALDSSSSPISSKLPTSESMVLSSDWEEERKEEDFEDFEPDKSGGEPGIGELMPGWSAKFMASSYREEGEVRTLCSEAILTEVR